MAFSKREFLLPCLVLLAVCVASPARADAVVSLVQGIPDRALDVYLDGELAVAGAAYTSISAPLTFPAGSYAVAAFDAGADPRSVPPLVRISDVVLPDGAISLALHLHSDGTPALTAFVDDLSPGRPFASRLVVRHLAAAPELEVTVRSRGAFTLANGAERAVETIARPALLAFTAVDDARLAFGPTRVNPRPGSVLVVYAVGELLPDDPGAGGGTGVDDPGGRVDGDGPAFVPWRWRRSAARATGEPLSTFAVLSHARPMEPR